MFGTDMDVNMVEYEEYPEKQVCICTTEKLKTKVIIQKSVGGNIFFEFKFEKGKIPQELSGRYTSIKKAQIGLEKYLRKQPKSKTVLRDERAELREKERNAAKLESKGS